jgi:hypothetical protein
MAKRKHELTDRDRSLLQFVGQYRLGTDELFRWAFFPDVADLRAVRKVTFRLVQHNYLRKFQLGPKAAYYVLAPRACRLVGAKVREPVPFTEQSFPGAFGAACFCVRTGAKRYTAAQFLECHPDLCKPTQCRSNYFKEEVEGRFTLGLFLIDRATSPKRMMAKIRKVIAQRYRLPIFRDLILCGKFQVIILTGYPAKCVELEQAVRDGHRGPVRVRVVVVAELGEWLTGA